MAYLCRDIFSYLAKADGCVCTNARLKRTKQRLKRTKTQAKENKTQAKENKNTG